MGIIIATCEVLTEFTFSYFPLHSFQHSAGHDTNQYFRFYYFGLRFSFWQVFRMYLCYSKNAQIVTWVTWVTKIGTRSNSELPRGHHRVGAPISNLFFISWLQDVINKWQLLSIDWLNDKVCDFFLRICVKLHSFFGIYPNLVESGDWCNVPH